jgi:NAD(P)-dependent dehydrogenase (short-subunit alcohol dehydrogenase family)
MGRLDGRVALVTGGAQSIGAAFAKGLAAEGAQVVIADLVSADDIVNIIKQAGGNAVSVVADITDEHQCEDMVKQAVSKFGRLDILVANAGIWVQLEREDATQISIEEWDKVMNVNIKGTWLSAKAAIPQMVEQGYGKIITLTSTRAIKGGANMLHYDASKGAIMSMTKSLAREWGSKGIRVNAIAPGATDTEFSLAHMDKDQEERRKLTPQTRSIKRAQDPEDLVGTCVFLASSASDFMTAQTVPVEGGAVFW